MIFETSAQARFPIPMTISLGIGVLFLTVFTMVLIPAGYIVLEDLRPLARRLRPPASTPPGP